MIPHLPHHVIQRGNNRTALFHADEDYGFYLGAVKSALRRTNLALHTYVLMTNHAHFIVTPPTRAALPKAMHSIGQRYATYYNQRYARSGGRFDGRYRSTVIDTDTYLYTCMRYVEMNPVRAGIVTAPHLYRWSSHAAHAHGVEDEIVTFHPMYVELGATRSERQAGWRAICEDALPEPELAAVRHAVHFGGSLGPVRLPAEDADDALPAGVQFLPP